VGVGAWVGVGVAGIVVKNEIRFKKIHKNKEELRLYV